MISKMALTLQAVAENIWVVAHPFEIMKVKMGTHTTIIRLQNGGLWLLSPGAGLSSLKKDLACLGPVAAIVAPNTMHHMFLSEAIQLFPEARVYGPSGLKRKQPTLAIESLTNEIPALWQQDIDQIRLNGLSFLQETAFFHPSSRSLIVTDLVFNLQHSDHAWSRLFMRMNDAYCKLGPSRMLRKMVLKDPAALALCLEAILAWDFDRIILAHGEIVSSGGKALLREAFERVGVLKPQTTMP
jgi:hypothetical protein